MVCRMRINNSRIASIYALIQIIHLGETELQSSVYNKKLFLTLSWDLQPLAKVQARRLLGSLVTHHQKPNSFLQTHPWEHTFQIKWLLGGTPRRGNGITADHCNHAPRLRRLLPHRKGDGHNHFVSVITLHFMKDITISEQEMHSPMVRGSLPDQTNILS